ncbi:hypothetical protein BGZ72_005388 [Mortierella alpina]|nr:hypothetical protein BGZ72_005388 [Mortierella alpina]
MAKAPRSTFVSPSHKMGGYAYSSRSLKASSRGKNTAAGRATTFNGQRLQHPRRPTQIKDMAFYGLPLEIIQHIALFLPFHDLVKVYKSLPAIHKPIFQQQLDHSLALLMLTLEFHQSSRDAFTVRPASINPWENALGSENALLQTQWRATSFDLERMWVVFELEEKLGLEAAERRRAEILHQQKSLRESSSSIHELLEPQYIWEQATEDFQEPTHDPTHAISAPPRFGSHRYKRPREPEEDLETRIWRARRNVTASGRTSPEPFQGTDATGLELEDLPDSNFFHCNGSLAAPSLRSATISFKAHRNVPAPWLSKCGSSYSTEEGDGPSCPQESAWTVRARERIAGFQQNRVLLRSLAKMRAVKDSEKAQFLPTAIELDTRELGLKKAEAIVLDPTLTADPSRGRRRPHSGPIRQATIAAVATERKGRRHSWHQLALTEDATFVSLAADDDEQNINGFSTVLKRILKAPSWPDSLSVLSPPEQQTQTRWSMDGSGTVDWSTILSDMAVSMYRSSMHTGRQGSRPRKPCVIIRTLPAPETEFSMHCDPVEHDDHGIGRRDPDDEEETVRQAVEVKERQLFELTYDIRHNFLHTSRLEGERVIRPIRAMIKDRKH